MTEFVIAWLIFLVFVLSGVIIFISRRHIGQIIVIQGEEGKKTFSLEINGDPGEIQNMKSVTFKVIKIEDIAD